MKVGALKPFEVLINGHTFDEDRINQTVNLGATEEWLLRNTSPDWHSFHIHVNDFQVMEIDDPHRGKTGVQDWGLDNVNVSAPVFGDKHVVSTPATLANPKWLSLPPPGFS